MTRDDVKLIGDLLPDAFILLSDSGSILNANAAAHELFRRDHLAGLALADLITDPAPRRLLRSTAGAYNESLNARREQHSRSCCRFPEIHDSFPQAMDELESTILACFGLRVNT